MDRKVILTPKAPAPIGPYSQAIEANGLIFCSGQIPLDPTTGVLVTGDIAVQTRRILDNLEAVLAAAGTNLHKCLKLTVYLVDLKDFEGLNRVLAERYENMPPPARSVVQVSALPKGARVEMDLIASKS